MQLYPRRRNVAAQVVEELKMVTYATPPMEEHRKQKQTKNSRCHCNGTDLVGEYLGVEPGMGLKELHQPLGQILRCRLGNKKV